MSLSAKLQGVFGTTKTINRMIFGNLFYEFIWIKIGRGETRMKMKKESLVSSVLIGFLGLIGIVFNPKPGLGDDDTWNCCCEKTYTCSATTFDEDYTIRVCDTESCCKNYSKTKSRPEIHPTYGSCRITINACKWGSFEDDDCGGEADDE
jgi:hypothetical protein